MKPCVFVPMIGQYENIGDIVLRRPLMNWLRDAGTLHVFIGNAPAGYAEGLGVRPEDVVYRSFGAWFLAAAKAALRGNGHYAFKPGEIQLSLPGLKEHVSVLPLLALIRLRGGRVIRIGSGARNFAPGPRALMKPSIAMSELVMWRDGRTAAYMGSGGVMPDMGFWEGEPVDAMQPSEARNALIVSMRGDREQATGEWIDAVKEFAATNNLEVWVVTQVLRDSELSQSLATALGGKLLDWDGTRHDDQEKELRNLYRRTAVAISDRLHVLIAAFTHGAAPVGLLAYNSDKIDRHFEAAGISGVSLSLADKNKAQIIEHLGSQMMRRTQMLSRLVDARQRMQAVRAEVIARLLPARLLAARQGSAS